MEADTSHPGNTGVLAYLEARCAPGMAGTRAPNSVRDPYYGLGSHPDIVERVWNELGAELPVDCRAIVHGSPCLVEPRGIILAVALGTAYGLRVPEGLKEEALRAGAKTLIEYWRNIVLDLPIEFGEDWICGGWFKKEPAWCRAVYDSCQSVG